MGGGDRYLNLCYVEDLSGALAPALERRTESGSVYFVAEERSYSWLGIQGAAARHGRVKARTIKIPYAAAYLIGLASEIGSLFTKRPALTNRQKVREAAQTILAVRTHGKIENDLRFRAEYPLQKGLELTWQWYRKNKWLL